MTSGHRISKWEKTDDAGQIELTISDRINLRHVFRIPAADVMTTAFEIRQEGKTVQTPALLPGPGVDDFAFWFVRAHWRHVIASAEYAEAVRLDDEDEDEDTRIPLEPRTSVLVTFLRLWCEREGLELTNEQERWVMEAITRFSSEQFERASTHAQVVKGTYFL